MSEVSAHVQLVCARALDAAGQYEAYAGLELLDNLMKQDLTVADLRHIYATAQEVHELESYRGC